MERRRQVLAVLLYGGCLILLAGSTTGLLKEVLPSAIGGRLAHNSEAWLVILVLCAWIQFVRPRIVGTGSQWAVTGAAAVVFLGVGLFFWRSTDLDTSEATLNEGLLALSLLIPYVMVRRPLPQWLPWTVAGAVLTVTVALNRTGPVTDLAETIGFLVLLPIGLDVVDRGILDPDAPTDPTVRYGWYAFLVVAPILFALIERNPPDGLAGEASRYAVRLTEGFVAALVIGVYFAGGLGRTGAPAPAAIAGPAARPT